MAKDDYDYIVFRILLYLYACFQRKCTFNETVLLKKAAEDINQDYFMDILRFMQKEELVEGLNYVRAWGNDYALMNDISEMQITPDGIHYLKDNSRMIRIRDTLLEHTGDIVDLIKIVLPL